MASARGDSRDHVVLAGSFLRHFVAAVLGGVFAGFGGRRQGLNASGNNELDGPWIGIEGGAAFGGVEGGDASASACADVDQASTFAQRGRNLVDSASDLRQGTLHGRGAAGVCLVEEAGELVRGLC